MIIQCKMHVDINQLKSVFLPTPTNRMTVMLKKSVIALPLPTVTHLTIFAVLDLPFTIVERKERVIVQIQVFKTITL